MIWAILAVIVLLAVFMRRVLTPMFFGAVIGALVFLIAPVFQFEAAPELIIFCTVVGLALGVGRAIIFGGDD